MRLSTLAVIGAAAYLSAVPALALGLQDVYGVWRHPDNGSLIQIYRCGGGICAKVVSVLDPNRTDVKNPDPALRGRPVVGIEIWRHAKETAPLQWSGSAYNPLDGATLYGTLHLTSETTLVVASCNLNVMPCFERTWTKVPSETAKTVSKLVSQPQADEPQVDQPKASRPKEAPPVETKVVAKPKLPSVNKAKKAKEQVKKRANRPGDSHGYYDLPHIHPAR